jgi:hypothetical protein
MPHYGEEYKDIPLSVWEDVGTGFIYINITNAEATNSSTNIELLKSSEYSFIADMIPMHSGYSYPNISESFKNAWEEGF